MASDLPDGWQEKIRADAKKIVDSMTAVEEMIKFIEDGDCDNAYQLVSHARTETDQDQLLKVLLGDAEGESYIEKLLEKMCPGWTPPSSQEYSQAASVSGGRHLRHRKTRNRRNKRRGASKKGRSRK